MPSKILRRHSRGSWCFRPSNPFGRSGTCGSAIWNKLKLLNKKTFWQESIVSFEPYCTTEMQCTFLLKPFHFYFSNHSGEGFLQNYTCDHMCPYFPCTETKYQESSTKRDLSFYHLWLKDVKSPEVECFMHHTGTGLEPTPFLRGTLAAGTRGCARGNRGANGSVLGFLAWIETSSSTLNIADHEVSILDKNDFEHIKKTCKNSNVAVKLQFWMTQHKILCCI